MCKCVHEWEAEREKGKTNINKSQSYTISPVQRTPVITDLLKPLKQNRSDFSIAVSKTLYTIWIPQNKTETKKVMSVACNLLPQFNTLHLIDAEMTVLQLYTCDVKVMILCQRWNTVLYLQLHNSEVLDLNIFKFCFFILLLHYILKAYIILSTPLY